MITQARPPGAGPVSPPLCALCFQVSLYPAPPIPVPGTCLSPVLKTFLSPFSKGFLEKDL